MRLVTWNCRIGGFRWKAQHVASLGADVLAVQEVEPIDSLRRFSGDRQPTFRDRSAAAGFPRRGFGMFSYTQTTIEAVDGSEPFSAVRRYEARHHGLSFNVIGVWTWGTGSVKTAYRQSHEGLERHEHWIRQRDTVVLGDFNANASFKGKNWRQLSELMDALDLVSAYHSHFEAEPFGQEKMATHFHRGKESARFHLDYCFIPRAWKDRIKTVAVGSYADWHKVSDHAPVIVDLSLETDGAR
jgi:endonuclease/exonuclease/phosphatase family metal-dependent hydrolase